MSSLRSSILSELERSDIPKSESTSELAIVMVIPSSKSVVSAVISKLLLSFFSRSSSSSSSHLSSDISRLSFNPGTATPITM